jgi:uncharacterized membrane protein YphA (DoxX/SURF4 family)
VQRLYSTFPNSWPGGGLLVLRVCLGTTLIYAATAGLSQTTSELIAVMQNVIVVAGGLLLVAGLWTPLIGVLVAVVEAWKALSLYASAPNVVWIHSFLAVLSLSVAMLGPGAWSIDARLFGRTRFDIDRKSFRER